MIGIPERSDSEISRPIASESAIPAPPTLPTVHWRVRGPVSPNPQSEVDTLPRHRQEQQAEVNFDYFASIDPGDRGAHLPVAPAIHEAHG